MKAMNQEETKKAKKAKIFEFLPFLSFLPFFVSSLPFVERAKFVKLPDILMSGHFLEWSNSGDGSREAKKSKESKKGKNAHCFCPFCPFCFFCFHPDFR